MDVRLYLDIWANESALHLETRRIPLRNRRKTELADVVAEEGVAQPTDDSGLTSSPSAQHLPTRTQAVASLRYILGSLPMGQTAVLTLLPQSIAKYNRPPGVGPLQAVALKDR